MHRGSHIEGSDGVVVRSAAAPTVHAEHRPRALHVARDVTGGLIGLGVSAAALALFVTVVRQAPAPQVAPRPDDVLLVLLGWVGLLLAGWLALGSLLAVAALLPGTAGRAAARMGDRITPVAVRKVLALALGASVGSMALPPVLVSVAGSGPLARGTDPEAAPAAGAVPIDRTPGFTPSELTPGFVPTVAHPPSTPASGVLMLPDGPGYVPTPRPGYVPTAPPAVHDADRSRLLAPTPRAMTAADDLVPVRRGDSLWSIAARHLGPTATDAEVAWEWPRWYAANRDVVGEDPDLLTPGQLLRPPEASVSDPAASHPSVRRAGADTSFRAQQGAQ